MWELWINARVCLCVSEEEEEDEEAQTPKKKALEMAKFRITRGLWRRLGSFVGFPKSCYESAAVDRSCGEENPRKIWRWEAFERDFGAAGRPRFDGPLDWSFNW